MSRQASRPLSGGTVAVVRRAGVKTGDGRKLAEVVAARIEDDIARRGWPIGAVLGSEAELLERYGVSRAVLREAVRIVEHHLVAVMRRGPGGGLVVTAPDISAIVRAVTLQLEFQDIQPQHLFEARAALERQCVRLACERLTPDGILQLRRHRDRGRRDGSHPDDFHVLVAKLTGNPAMALFIRVLDVLMGEHLGESATSARIVADLHRIHQQIAEAIIARDTDLAERRMLRHLETTKGWLAQPKRGRGAAAGGRRRRA